ncbi:hypothetical protein ACS0TY_016207 [Phlomoides rotata]
MQRKKPTPGPTFNRFDLLSEEIVFVILDLLNDNPLDRKSFSLVCRSFCAIESRHRRFLKPLRSELLGKVLSRYSNASIIDLSLCPRVTDASLSVIWGFCKDKLRSINLSRSKSFTHVGLSNLIRNCGNLVELNLSNANELRDSAAEVIGEAKNLERLWLSRCRWITNIGLGCIATGCRKLRLLSLNWLTLVDNVGVGLVAVNCKELRSLDLSHMPITNRCLSQIFLELKQLEVLVLKGCSWLNNNRIAALKEGCKSLVKLDMTSCEEVSHVGLSSITTATASLRQIILSYGSCVDPALVGSLQKLSSLQSIKLDGCKVTSSGLKAIGQLCLSLLELSLSMCIGVTDEGLSYIVKNHKHLRKLDITCCRDITEVSIDHLTESCTSLISLKMKSCWLVSDVAFVWIGQGCPFLQELDLTHNEIDDEGLKSISKCSRLKILTLGICLNITDEGLIHIGMSCSKLKQLELYKSDGIADSSISAIASGCPDLETITISYCHFITDRSLMSLSKCSKLKTLEARGCYLITRDGLAAVAKGCKLLSKLDIKYCHNVDDFGMIPLARFSQNLKQINLSYTSVTDVGLLTLASIGCLQAITILHFAGLTPNGLADALLACSGLTKIEAPASFKSSIPERLLKHLKARGSTFIWSYKYQAELDPM